MTTSMCIMPCTEGNNTMTTRRTRGLRRLRPRETTQGIAQTPPNPPVFVAHDDPKAAKDPENTPKNSEKALKTDQT